MARPIDTSLNTKQCFNCGHDLENDVAFCPYCRAPLPTQGSGFSIAQYLINLLICAVFALIFGVVGACLLVGSTMFFSMAPIESLSFGAMGIAFLFFAGLSIYCAISLQKWR